MVEWNTGMVAERVISLPPTCILVLLYNRTALDMRVQVTDLFPESNYSGTSNKGPSEKETTSIQRTLFWAPFLVMVHF